ncbi:MAG: CHC2 zinc finger domain-containing protein, partial [Pseudomonadota bacterium]
MPRVPDDELARLKADISLMRLVEADGVALTRKGADYHGHCPFHDDKTPSLVISPKTNLYHCFGCGAAGSVIDWVMNRRELSFRDAVSVLQEDLPPLAAAPVVDASSSDPAMLDRVVRYYHQTLKQ